MKTNQKVAVTIIVLVGFVVGLVIGVSLTNPGMSVFEAAGSIGKVDKYRNVKITEDDIELRNTLLTDESLREAYREYLIFEYTAHAKMAEDIQYSLDAAREIAPFRAANAEIIMQLESYSSLIDNARVNILEGIAALSMLPDMNRIAIQSILNDVSNALAQASFRNNILFDYIDVVELFIEGGPRGEFSRLEKAHDLIFVNLLSSSIINDNKFSVRYLMFDKELLTRFENLAMNFDVLQERIALDMRYPAGVLVAFDQEKLGVNEAGRIGVFWAGREYMNFTAEHMESIFGLREIRAFNVEQMHDFIRNEHFRTFDFGQVEFALDTEVLQDLIQARELFDVFALSHLH